MKNSTNIKPDQKTKTKIVAAARKTRGQIEVVIEGVKVRAGK